jgi:hypothetical protein
MELVTIADGEEADNALRASTAASTSRTSCNLAGYTLLEGSFAIAVV